MDLLSLPGHTLRLYLSLLDQGDRVCLDQASWRALGRQSGLDRRTIPASLARLQEAGLVELHDQTCRVDPAPLAALLARRHQMARGNEDLAKGDTSMYHPKTVAGTSMDQDGPARSRPDEAAGTSMYHPGLATGPSMYHPEPGAGTCMDQGGTSMCHPRPEIGTSMDQPATPSTRIRTSWSSSDEEDGTCTTPLSSPPAPTAPNESQTDTSQPDETWLTAMLALWTRIAPDQPHDPRWWLRHLHRTYGPEIPQQVFTAFTQDGQTLSQLEHPQYYRAWFETRCSERRQRHPLTGALAWLHRRQEQTAAPTAGITSAANQHEPVPLNAVLTEAMPAKQRTSEPLPAPTPGDGTVRSATTKSADAVPGIAGVGPAPRPCPSPRLSRRMATAYAQDLRQLYEAQRERAWSDKTVTTPLRPYPSRRSGPGSRPPTTGPPRDW